MISVGNNLTTILQTGSARHALCSLRSSHVELRTFSIWVHACLSVVSSLIEIGMALPCQK